MNIIRIVALAVTFLFITVPGANAAEAPVTFGVRYFAEGGGHQTYLAARQGGGMAGEAWLNASDHDGRPVRALVVCDRRDDGIPVSARILVPDGRALDYSAPAGARCFERQLGYRIARWQLLFGSESSGAVTPPPLV
ncbi:hypothetical protein [Cryptosporangium sp. NPDC048952]|uniref:hypothetical protein n=1 Tax=Cryptosporangium sp. NPDC048952 TaxID=3363961 RepID=UPI00371811EA